MNFKKALSYSAIESIGSRSFDLLTLWVVLNTLSSEDIALFGVATASIFIFNFFLLTPETALLKYQKKWQEEEVLQEYISAFFSFSFFKVTLHYILALIAYLIAGELNWFVYAIVFSAITQHIQMAEVCRIYFRMELMQRKVAQVELVTKLSLLMMVCMLFIKPSIEVYFSCYLVWSLAVTLAWVKSLQARVKITLSYNWPMIYKLKTAMLGYSLWTHITGVMTMFIYNSNILFLKWLEQPVEDIVLFTVVNKVANLFFVVPMFFQSFVPVVLANAGAEIKSEFNKVLAISAVISVGQFIVFLLSGYYIGLIFGVDENDVERFYQIGVVVCLGIMILNISRPLSTFLLIRTKAESVMFSVFVPAFIIALIVYPSFISQSGVDGAAYGALSIYAVMAMLLVVRFLRHGVKST